MTQEEKSRAYDEAIKRAKEINNEHKAQPFNVMLKVFPELKESEERIRKAIIESLPKYGYLPQTSIKVEDAIAWLGKQGEQKAHLELKAGKWYICHRAYCCRADHLTVKEGERFLCQEDGVVKGFVITDPEKYFREVSAPIEATAATYTTEVETGDGGIKALVTGKVVMPKFKVGDWIANDYCMGKVIALTDDAYLLDTGQGIPFSCEYNAHLWTIADAKDGDVLQLGVVTAIFKESIGNGNCKCYCSVCNGEFEIPSQDSTDNSYGCHNATPATKERRDLLFQKMKEAGYEWDAEKKELKKIVQKTAWSEEDEKMLKSLKTLLNNASCYLCTETTDKIISWLKSLRPQNTWKPSESDILLLERIANGKSNPQDFQASLDSLIGQLKKLREDKKE